MNRRAILIGASPISDPIPGVYADLNTWHDFLCSNIGGAWDNSEIRVVDKHYTRQEIIAAVNSVKMVDYSLIVFAGHGETVIGNLPWSQTLLHLTDDESILERDLNPGTPRCTLVLDCCRKSPEIIEEAISFTDKSAAFKAQKSSIAYRTLYDKYLMSAESGLVTIYSTEIGYGAADKYSFSQHMIYQAREWVKQNKGVLSLSEGVFLASESIKQINPQQTPEYQGGRRLRHFPLAVSI